MYSVLGLTNYMYLQGCTQKAIRHRISRLQSIAGVKEEPGTPKRGPKKSKVLLTDGKASPSQRKRSKSNEDEMEQFEKKTKLEKEEDLDEFA
ncbi:hypothetical protein LOZ53_001042 [Ophidiomyces ophidiicola]|nr:hypothetical protein LOZ55_004173 [Ophidiomyces ophidiicola]KAI1994821.1 hypothetical protein LOZ54_000874 [Ophidiomyces ophidiicola]KAI1996441.1 hypothetical protein LOZ53_001042 [Ophidiomyces ophidiicola]KAI2001053.1 hypothetical protein LOZ51_001344 [Ophidiomyces ophidiicola]